MKKLSKKDKAAKVAALSSNVENAQMDFDALTDTSTAEEKQSADQKLQSAIKELNDFNDANPDDVNDPDVIAETLEFAKIKFLLSPTGCFGLGYNVGEEAELESKICAELVDAAYAEYVDETEK